MPKIQISFSLPESQFNNSIVIIPIKCQLSYPTAVSLRKALEFGKHSGFVVDLITFLWRTNLPIDEIKT